MSNIFNKLFQNIKILDYLDKPSIVIKTPVTKWRRAKNWGDYHLAVLLKQQLQRKGHKVLIQILPEWDSRDGIKYDVAIVFRGLSRYAVKPHQLNIMWNISHPDDVTLGEYESYDQVFIASDFWVKKIAKQVSVPVEVMLQCTDVKRFKEPNDRERNKYHHQLLFVGNSRDVYRKILKDLLPTKYDLAVYGKNWKRLLPKNIIRGEYLKNEKLYRYYGSAGILLNDHWDDMREKGFVSNRIYDGLACGAFILTDSVSDIGELKEYVQVYNTPEELSRYIDYYLENPRSRKYKAKRGMYFVQKHHTFEQRSEQFSLTIEKLMKDKLS